MDRKTHGIITCMDSRLDPIRISGLSAENTHVIRNAGGRVTNDAIRSMIIAHKFLGTKDWQIIHHTDCMVGKLTDEIIQEALAFNIEPAEFDGDVWQNNKSSDINDQSNSISQIEWQTFTDLEQSLIEDIEIIKSHPLIPDDINISGYVFDLSNDELKPI